MTFPVPKDVRAARDFELWQGQDELIRQSAPLDDATKPVTVGEWMKPGVGGTAVKLDSGDDIDTPAMGAKVSWTQYVPGDSATGQTDALATKSADLLSGTYQARTKLYNTGGSFLAPGNLLVAVYDVTLDGGILDAPDPSSYTATQIAAAIGRIIDVADGVLHYESPI